MPAICFQTHEFPTAPEGDLELCNGQPGSAVADWVRSLLVEAGIACKQNIQEDYGWGFWLESDAAVWVAVSHAEGEGTPEWWISVTHETPFFAISQWFKRKQGRELVAQVFARIRQAVEARFDVQRVEA